MQAARAKAAAAGIPSSEPMTLSELEAVQARMDAKRRATTSSKFNAGEHFLSQPSFAAQQLTASIAVPHIHEQRDMEVGKAGNMQTADGVAVQQTAMSVVPHHAAGRDSVSGVGSMPEQTKLDASDVTDTSNAVQSGILQPGHDGDIIQNNHAVDSSSQQPSHAADEHANDETTLDATVAADQMASFKVTIHPSFPSAALGGHAGCFPYLRLCLVNRTFTSSIAKFVLSHLDQPVIQMAPYALCWF